MTPYYQDDWLTVSAEAGNAAADSLRALATELLSYLPNWPGHAEWERRLAALPEPGTLDEAWAAAEAALPEGHVLAELRLFDDRTRWGASTDNETGVGRYHWSGDGLTPAAALLDLARVLREAK